MQSNGEPLQITLNTGDQAEINYISPQEWGAEEEEGLVWVISGVIKSYPSLKIYVEYIEHGTHRDGEFRIDYPLARELEEKETEMAYTLYGVGHELLCAIFDYIKANHPDLNYEDNPVRYSESFMYDSRGTDREFLNLITGGPGSNVNELLKKCGQKRQKHIAKRVTEWTQPRANTAALKATWNQYCQQIATGLHAEYYLPELRGMARELGLRYSGLNKMELCQRIGTFITIMEGTGAHPKNLEGWLSDFL